MVRMIDIKNPSTGKTLSRPGDTYTLDVPPDFDRVGGVVSVDARSQAHHVSVDGRTLDYNALTRPLSWRIYGEECLVADKPGKHPTAFAGTYRLRSIKRPA